MTAGSPTTAVAGHRPVSLVTGAASGIGRAAALAFAARGDRVVLADLDPDGLAATAAQIDGMSPGAASTVLCDVRSESQVSALAAQIADRLGRLDNAFNNAGVEQRRARIADCDEENWDRTIDIDLKGVFLCLKHEIRLMRASGGGCIVNTSSIVGTRGVAGAPAYVAAKHGIIGLTRCAAVEEAENGIRVNAVAPGHILTPMVQRVIAKEPAKEQTYLNNAPQRRLGSPEEVADVVLWLCSAASSFVTGDVIAVDGGVAAK